MIEKVSGECQTRQKLAKKRRLHLVSEHFEPVFNAVWRRMGLFLAAGGDGRSKLRNKLCHWRMFHLHGRPVNH